MKTKMIRMLFTGLAVAGLVAACGDDGDEFPTGSYTPDDPTAEGAYIEFRDDGTFELYFASGAPFDQGTYTVDGDTLTWVTDGYCQVNGGETATYTWEWEDDVLNMVPDENGDPCGDRIAFTSSGLVPIEVEPATTD